MTYTSEVLADAPILFARCGGVTQVSALADSSGNNRNGSSVRGTPVYGQRSLVPNNGAGDLSCTFAGSAGLIWDNPAWADVTSITIEAWITLTSLGSLRTIIERDRQGARLWGIGVNSSNRLLINFWTATGGLKTITTPAGNALQAGVTAHMAFTYDSVGGTGRFYINGAEVGSVVSGGALLTNSTSTLVVASGYGGGVSIGAGWAGGVDDVSIYPTPLSAARILAHYNAGIAAPAPSPDLSTLTDDFSGTLAKWPGSNAGATIVSGQAQLPLTGTNNYTVLSTGINTYNLAGSGAYAKVTPPSPPDNGSREVTMEVRLDINNKAFINWVGSLLVFRVITAGTTTTNLSVTYNATSMAWWRIHSTGPTNVQFSTSPDGIAWTLRAEATITFPMSALPLIFSAGNWSSEGVSNAYVDNVNTGGAVPAPPVGSGAYAVEILKDLPLVHMRLGGANSSALMVDSSGNARNATAVTGTPTYAQPSLILNNNGDLSCSFSVAGLEWSPAPGWVNIPSITLEAWANCISTNVYGSLLDRDSTQRAWQFRLTNSNKVEFLFWTSAGGPYFCTGTTNLTISTTYHFAATYDHTTGVAKVYVNGVQDGTVTVAANPLYIGNPPLAIGYSFGGVGVRGQYFPGRLDEVAVYGAPLTAARLLAHYQAGSVAAPTNDCWVWNGTTAIEANVFVWDGTTEVPASLAVT